MLESDEESAVSTKRSYGPGEDIFGKYDPNQLVEDDSTDNSIDEDEEEVDEDEEDEDEDEKEEVYRKMKNIQFDMGCPSECNSKEFTRLQRKLWQNIKIRTYKTLKKWHMRN